jgi:hypothetical protein
MLYAFRGLLLVVIGAAVGAFAITGRWFPDRSFGSSIFRYGTMGIVLLGLALFVVDVIRLGGFRRAIEETDEWRIGLTGKYSKELKGRFPFLALSLTVLFYILLVGGALACVYFFVIDPLVQGESLF